MLTYRVWREKTPSKTTDDLLILGWLLSLKGDAPPGEVGGGDQQEDEEGQETQGEEFLCPWSKEEEEEEDEEEEQDGWNCTGRPGLVFP